MARIFLSPLHKAIRQISLYFEENGREAGLTPGESHMLAYLRVYQPTPVSELHRVFGIKRSTLTSQLDRLEKQGLIGREVSPDDRRSFLVSLTPEGDATAHRIEVHTNALEDRIRSGVTEDDIAGFNAVIEAVASATNIDVVANRKEVIK